MSYTITNQKPASLDPVHLIPIKGDYDPVPALKKTLIDPLYQAVGNHPVSILDENSAAVNADAVLNLALSVVGEQVDPDGNDRLKDIYQQSLVHYDKRNPLLVNEIFVVQAAQTAKLPAPVAGSVIYTATSDVQPAATALLAGAQHGEEQFLASLGYLYHPETLGFWFQTADEFDDFTAWVAAEVANLSGILPGAVVNLFSQFIKTKLSGLTESLILRNDDDSENEEYSFARTLIRLLMAYQVRQSQNLASGSATQKTSGVLPFVLSELYLPKTVVLVNVDAHARAAGKKINNEWLLITKSLSAPVKVVSNKTLSKLTALPRAAAKAAAAAATVDSNRRAQKGRSASVAFRKKAPSSVDILTGLSLALSRMKQVNKSMNAIKKVKTTMSRANRRDPDDFNKPGKSVSTHYLPDLHIYLDCSGSISEDNYQDSVIMLIKLAKKLNINLYFNSFSRELSQTVLLKTQNKSTAAIWREFRRIPKVSGGTDFGQVWDYINEHSKRRERLNLMITDFEWWPGTSRREHPKNLYYAPVSNMNWDIMVRSIEMFTKSMRHNDPAIHQKLIGVVK